MKSSVPWWTDKVGLLGVLTPLCLPADPSTAETKCDKACRLEEECTFLNGTWGCACRRDLNSSGEQSVAEPPGQGREASEGEDQGCAHLGVETTARPANMFAQSWGWQDGRAGDNTSSLGKQPCISELDPRDKGAEGDRCESCTEIFRAHTRGTQACSCAGASQE